MKGRGRGGGRGAQGGSGGAGEGGGPSGCVGHPATGTSTGPTRDRPARRHRPKLAKQYPPREHGLVGQVISGGAMLYAFGFERVGVVASDMYIVIPTPVPGQEGAERGVRLEVRLLERGELQGSIYSARPIEVGRPVWRADLLEAAAGPPGSLDRAHHHPAFRGWEPGKRVFDADLTARPVQWVAGQL